MAKYTYALGRRKTSVATVRLYEGKGETLINEKALNIAYTKQYDKKVLLEPLVLIEGLDKYYFTAKTSGGGRSGQVQAIRHALSRALAEQGDEFKAILKKAHLLTRDDRMKERKKTGLRKARKAPQYSKR
ncbi:MAG: 30S ribosomal protein S9 [candidate division WS6 bacterium GW2011_GWA2_37_6]|uniref:30S ribosomal protein S9 n=1 Tax=candidate division WS6 bacterium GW2011_GWA2_37_6 TaxID=1619087 RepID=A0A0G0HCK3_9BACT|nr:MAG: 30S ribosomal protein S9 [candidate division WS6 bacterium GW2011_GWA2_37_6]